MILWYISMIHISSIYFYIFCIMIHFLKKPLAKNFFDIFSPNIISPFWIIKSYELQKAKKDSHWFLIIFLTIIIFLKTEFIAKKMKRKISFSRFINTKGETKVETISACRLLVNTLNDFNFGRSFFFLLPLFYANFKFHNRLQRVAYIALFFYRRSPKSRAFFPVNNSALYTTFDKNLYWFWEQKLLWITAWGKQWSFSEKSPRDLCLWSNSRSIKWILLCSILCQKCELSEGFNK